jgi:arylsulfatase A-like enzyme
MPEHPNILWIMTDQHRADCLGCMGHPLVQTPHLDRLASEGIVFENAFCQSPVCMASRGSLFTGRYPATIRIRGMGILPPGETTTPEWCQRHGYRTGAFGKVHLTPELYTKQVLGSDRPILDLRPFARDAGLGPLPDDPCKVRYGFQEHMGAEDCLQGAFREWLTRTNPEEAGRKPDRIPGGPGDLFVSPYSSTNHLTTYIARHAESFIRGHTAPWFAFCSFVAPHHPFEAPADQIARYAEATIPLPAAKGGVDGRFIPEPARKAVDEVNAWPDSIKRRVALHYYAAISLIDDGVGRLVKALQDTGQMDNTILVFNADHGEFLGNHGLIRKPSLHYDEILRVPLILRLPGQAAAGRRVRGLVELTDLHPTLLRLAGLPVNPGVQGRDWSGALLENQPIGRDSILSDMYDDCVRQETCGIPSGGPFMAVQTLRTDRWKLSVYPTAGPEYGQLFDLEADPDEAHNQYGNPDLRDVREHLLWQLLQRVAGNTDPLPRVLSQW